MKPTFWSSEKLVSFAAVLISLMTFIVFIYQTNLIRKQQYMSVYPHLDLGNHNSWTVNYKYVLENQGVGPAFIKSIEVRERGGETFDDLVDFIEGKITKADSIEFHYSDLRVGQLIQPQQKIILFGLSDQHYTKPKGLPANTIRSANRLREIINNDSVAIRITYESIYGERWTLDRDEDAPIKH